MALEKKVIDFPMQIGLDTKTDPKQIKADSAAVIENFRYDQITQVKPRNGFSHLVTTMQTGSYPTQSKKVFGRDNDIVLDGKEGVYTYKGVIGSFPARWYGPNPSSEYLKLTQRKDAYNTNLFYPAFDTNGILNAFYDGLSIRVEDTLSGVVIFKEELGVSLAYAQVVIFSDFVWLFYYTSATTIVARRWDLATFTGTTSGTLITLASSTSPIYVQKRADSEFVVAVEQRLAVFSKSSFTALATNTNANNIEDVTATVTPSPSDERIIIVFFNGTTPSFRMFNWSLVQTVASTSMGSGTYSNNRRITVNRVGLTARWAACIAGWPFFTFGRPPSVYSATVNEYTLRDGISGGVVLPIPTGESLGFIGTIPLSKPFTFDGKNYVFLLDPWSGQAYLRSADVRDNQPVVCKIGEPNNFGGFLDPRVYVDSNYFQFAFTTTRNNLSNSFFIINKFEKNALSFGQAISYNRVSYLPKNGFLQYDGFTFTHVNFMTDPFILTHNSIPTPGGVSAGTYQYAVVLKYKDNSGKIHRSVASIPYTVTLASDSVVEITLTGAYMDLEKRQVEVELYRSIAGGSVLYLITQQTFSPSLVFTITNLGTPSVFPGASNPAIYITGGVLDSVAVSAIKTGCIHQNRVFGVSSEDPNLIYYTKEIDSEFAPEFNEDLFIRVDQGNGGILGVASLDDKLIVFKRYEIFVIVGEGPSPSGVNATYSLPNLITADCGLSEENGIQIIPDGILFKSLRGWQLLSRNLQLAYIGAPVERFNDLTVSATVRDEKKNLVYCLHTNGNALVYDYVLQRWVQWTNQNALAADVINDQLVALNTSGGVVRQFSDSNWLDNGTYENNRIVTSWIGLTGLQGFQRVYEMILFGEFRGDHQLRVRVSYDYDPSWKEEFTVSSDSLKIGTALTDSSYYSGSNSLGGKPALTLQYKFKPYLQLCESIRFEITVLNASNTNGETIRISGLSLTCGMKPKTNRMNAERVVT